MVQDVKPRLGKNVFILGAGASAHTGAPLLNDFMPRAQSLFRSGRELQWRPDFERGLRWVDGLRSSAYYVELNVANLEHVISVARMAEESGFEGAKEVYDCLMRVIVETLDLSCQVMVEARRPMPDRVYESFVKCVSSECGYGPHGKHPRATPDTIVSLNYDVMLEHAMRNARMPWTYCLTAQEAADKLSWPVLKLHGSVNWAVHEGCPKGTSGGKPVMELDPFPLLNGESFVTHEAEPFEFPFRMVTHVMAGTPCAACGAKREEGVLRPVIMPPTWIKRPQEEGIETVWRRAIDEIAEATQLVIIGYSMPQTDMFISYMLALGLQRNDRLRRVLVVNPDESEQLKDRYKHVFSRSLDERKGIVFVPATFERFVDGSWKEAHCLVAEGLSLAQICRFAGAMP